MHSDAECMYKARGSVLNAYKALQNILDSPQDTLVCIDLMLHLLDLCSHLLDLCSHSMDLCIDNILYLQLVQSSITSLI